MLVVDDDKVQRLLLRHMLTSAGHDVDEAGAVADAIARFDEAAFDVVISDFEMPGGSGLDLLDGLSEHRAPSGAPAPFVLLTGHHQKNEFADMRVHDVDAFLTKPVSTGALRACIREILGDGLLLKNDATPGAEMN